MDIEANNESFHEIEETSNSQSDDKNNITHKFICEVCGKTFQTKSGLTRHSGAHANTSKYSCQMCKKNI